MLFHEKPQDIYSLRGVVGCFVEHDGEILLLKRPSQAKEGNKWGVPAGKMERDESPDEAMVRELSEETGMVLPREVLTLYQTFFVRYPDRDFTFHAFHTVLQERLPVEMNTRESTAYRWILPREALRLPIVRDEDSRIRHFYELA